MSPSLLFSLKPPSRLPPGADVHQAGSWAEQVVAHHLWRRGHRTVAHRWVGPDKSDIDLIAANRHYLLFCEVKLRTDPEVFWEDVLNEERLRRFAGSVGQYLRETSQRMVSIRCAAFLVRPNNHPPTVEVMPDYINLRTVPGWRGRLLPQEVLRDLS
ncbi:MAG: YraN family protein [Candidatus Sumerlaeia bacterium]|nr:YraN family protein [Candidatus Sumerlaeia bacterium]